MSAENVTSKELVITRVIKAPRKLVFEAFTEAKHLAHWWGPKGFTLDVHSLEVKPGGRFHYCMKNEQGFEMWGLFVYHEINKPENIKFVNSFADKDGNIIRAPFPGMVWPLEVFNNWTFTEENGETTLVLRGHPINATEEEIKTFEDGFSSMNQGFNGTFDQLDEYLLTF